MSGKDVRFRMLWPPGQALIQAAEQWGYSGWHIGIGTIVRGPTKRLEELIGLEATWLDE